MVNDIARTISTFAIWGAIAAILMTLKINGDGNMVTNIMVGMTLALSAGAAFGTFAIWRSPRPVGTSSPTPSGPSKVPDREV